MYKFTHGEMESSRWHGNYIFGSYTSIEFIHFRFKNALENLVCEMAAILSRPQCVNMICTHLCFVMILVEVVFMLVVLPGHQQPRYWLYILNLSLPSMTRWGRTSNTCAITSQYWEMTEKAKWLNICIRADCRLALSQWDTALLCNVVSHWLGANLESALCMHTGIN